MSSIYIEYILNSLRETTTSRMNTIPSSYEMIQQTPLPNDTLSAIDRVIQQAKDETINDEHVYFPSSPAHRISATRIQNENSNCKGEFT